MHEMAIAVEVIDEVSRVSAGARVVRIVLEVGRLSMVQPEALRFSLEIASADTPAEAATIEIIEIPGRARCRVCRAEQAMERPYGQCGCGSLDLEWLEGQELRLKAMEVS